MMAEEDACITLLPKRIVAMLALMTAKRYSSVSADTAGTPYCQESACTYTYKAEAGKGSVIECSACYFSISTLQDSVSSCVITLLRRSLDTFAAPNARPAPLLLLFLGGRDIRERLVDGLHRAEDVLQLGLVDDSLAVAHDVRELGAEGRVKVHHGSAFDDGGHADIGERDALAYKESTRGKVRLEGLEGPDLALNESVVDLKRKDSVSGGAVMVERRTGLT